MFDASSALHVHLGDGTFASCLELGIGGSSASSNHSLITGCGALLATLPSDDDDGDGVTNAVEDSAANGGDGNDDGIADKTQPRVTSASGVTAVLTGCDANTGLLNPTEASL